MGCIGKTKNGLSTCEISYDNFYECETWNIDHSIAKFILPRLEHYACVVGKSHFIDEAGKTVYLKEIAEEILDGIRIAASDDYWDAEDKQLEIIRNSLKVFSKYFIHLWW